MRVMQVQKQISADQRIRFEALVVVDNGNDRIMDALLDPQLKDEEARSLSDKEASPSLFMGWKDWSSKYNIICSRRALQFSKPSINPPTAISMASLLNSTEF